MQNYPVVLRRRLLTYCCIDSLRYKYISQPRSTELKYRWLQHARGSGNILEVIVLPPKLAQHVLTSGSPPRNGEPSSSTCTCVYNDKIVIYQRIAVGTDSSSGCPRWLKKWKNDTAVLCLTGVGRSIILLYRKLCLNYLSPLFFTSPRLPAPAHLFWMVVMD